MSTAQDHDSTADREDHEREVRARLLMLRAEQSVIAAFRVFAYELGWSLRGPVGGVNEPVKMACSKGHTAEAKPISVLAGGFTVDSHLGPLPRTDLEACFTCTRDRKRAEGVAAFPKYAADFDLWVLSDEKTEYGEPLKMVRCLSGHVFTLPALDPRINWKPSPNREFYNFKGQDPHEHPCPTCKRIRDSPKLAAFKANAASQGAMLLEPLAGRVTQRVTICCVVGHLSQIGINQGYDAEVMCRVCRTGRTAPPHDVFYVVSGTDTVTGIPTVKLGISSGAGYKRLEQHATAGLSQRHLLRTGLPAGVARTLEAALLAHLSKGGWKRTRGDEYFPVEALPVIVAFAEEWLDAAP
ncbi:MULTISPECIES: hypothetical protein [Streptomyces]|uniref:hypothetical protein n=1 Tax=Streptomyces TaxID=1883 RepID=UPI00131A88CB|nr:MULTISPECIES: hypothetical protein [Streptomyces]